MSDALPARANELREEFAVFDNWLDRYQYLIELGRTLPDYPEAERDAADKVAGCQSQVWMQAWVEDGRMRYRAVSDAAIVSGLIAVLLRMYDDAAPGEITTDDARFIGDLGLDQHLSQSRANGLHAMLERMRTAAAGAGV